MIEIPAITLFIGDVEIGNRLPIRQGSALAVPEDRSFRVLDLSDHHSITHVIANRSWILAVLRSDADARWATAPATPRRSG